MLHFSQDLETRKFLVGPETFGLKLLVSFLVSVLVPVSPNFNFLVSFFTRFGEFMTSWFRFGTRKPTFVCSLDQSWDLIKTICLLLGGMPFCPRDSVLNKFQNHSVIIFQVFVGGFLC